MPRKPGNIATDTAIMPWIIADTVIAEVDSCHPLKLTQRAARTLADKLAAHADDTYRANAEFRRDMRSKGNRGRDQLYVWMRHWLAAELRTTKPQVFRKLPQSFLHGHKLVCRRSSPK